MADKEHMKDGIIKRGNSYAAAVYVGRDENGKKIYRWVSAKSKSAVREKRTELLHDRNTGTMASPKGTLGELIQRWLDDYAKNLAPRTYEGYQSIFRSGISKPVVLDPTDRTKDLKPLGDTLLRDLRPDRIQKYYTAKQTAGDSPTTIRHHHFMLHGALDYAVNLQLLKVNPADAVTPPPLQHPEMHTLDEDGSDSVLEAAQDTPYFAIFHCSLYTGMRRSEVLALRWQDLDLIGAEVYVRRAMHQLYNKEIIFRGTKTARSARPIALLPETCDVLRKHLDNEMTLWFSLHKTVVEGEVKVDPFPNDRLVFCKWDGRPLLPGTISQAWRRLMGQLKHKGVRLHDARHTHATLLLKAGIHPKIVQERLGHATIATTLDLYTHVTPGMQKQAAEAFSETLRNRRISKGLANGGYVKSSESHDR